jgi:hypothetical protein
VLLNQSQRELLQIPLGVALDALNAVSEENPLAPLEWAQNRLLDAVLDHRRALSYAEATMQWPALQHQRLRTVGVEESALTD